MVLGGFRWFHVLVTTVAWVGYDHVISNKVKWNNCFSKFSNWVFAPDFYFNNFTKQFYKTLCGKFLNLAHYFPY